LDFPNGKRNKIVLVARELDYLIKHKMEEIEKQDGIGK
jgi:hypothetical protein